MSPIFNLPLITIASMLETAVGERVVTFDITIAPALQPPVSGSAESLVASFAYTTRTGKSNLNIFVKKLRIGAAGDAGESAALMLMTEVGFSVPRLYANVRDADGNEILFLEWLDPLAFGSSEDPDDRRQLLSLHAGLNAQPILPGMTSRPLPSLWYGPAITDSGAVSGALNRTWQRAQRGELGDELRRLCSNERDIERLCAHAGRLREHIEAMPLAPINQEMGFGYRPATGEAIAFDWHSLFVGPRLCSMEAILGAPPNVQSGFGESWLPVHSYADYYANQLMRWGGPHLRAEDVLYEARTLWLASRYTRYMDWWTDRAANIWQRREQLTSVIRALLDHADL